MSLSNKPRQKADYRLEKIDDELLLYHPSRTTIMYCNETASLVWQLCDGERTVQEIIDLLGAAYSEAGEAIATEVCATLEQFQQHHAIEYVDQDGQVVSARKPSP